jgi:predicted esterase YcpF (UPF0227 family)
VNEKKDSKILYLHGFASSGASGTVEILRKEFMGTNAADMVKVIAPDIPVDPKEALPFLKEIAEREQPNLIIGTSMGAMYAQQLHGFERICVNPSFALSKKYDIVYVGKHKWLNQRKDGATEFHITKEIISHFAEIEEHQFEGIDEVDRIFCHGLFGDEDDIGLPWQEEFEKHYPGMSRIFHGGHRMNANIVHHVLIPFIHELKIFSS